MKKVFFTSFLMFNFMVFGPIGALAQVETVTDTETAQLVDAINQTTGAFDQVDLGYIHSMGMQQKAWNNPMEHLGEGQTKPGYSKYNWAPDTVLPIRLREGMMTLINLPSWELIEKVHIGSPESFGGEIVAPNSLLLYADPAYLGVDSNMIIFGRSGNRYVFYLRSETFNTDKITQSVVDVLVGPRWTPVSDGGQMIGAGAASSMAAAPSPLVTSKTNGVNSSAQTVANQWLGTVPMDPESIRFDLDMFLPNPDDVDIAPEQIWRDNIFTYIDLGPKALTMTQRPIVNLLVQGSEVPVGSWARGPNSRLIVVEAIGDLVLRNGKKIICVKLRRDPASGLEYTDYTAANTYLSQPTGTPSIQSGANGYSPYDSGINAGNYYASLMGTDNNLRAIPQDVRQAPQTQQAIMQVTSTYPRGAIIPTVGGESIAIELGTSSKIQELEEVWKNIYAKNKDILSGYEPYYSVDATADGDVMEVFRLRAGMVKDAVTADSLCRKIGRRGFSCSVIRIQ